MNFFLLTVFLSSACLLSSCADFLSKRYTEKASDISADIVMHGIEVECFKFENHRWPNSFAEMISYQAKALPCIGLSAEDKQLWEEYPTALIQSVDQERALIIIKEKLDKNGKLLPLKQEIHINYKIDYERIINRVE